MMMDRVPNERESGVRHVEGSDINGLVPVSFIEAGPESGKNNARTRTNPIELGFRQDQRPAVDKVKATTRDKSGDAPHHVGEVSPVSHILRV